LKIWEGRGTTESIVVDYIPAGYLDRRPGILSNQDCIDDDKGAKRPTSDKKRNNEISHWY